MQFIENQHQISRRTRVSEIPPSAEENQHQSAELEGLVDGLLGDPGVQQDAKRHKDRPTKEQMRERIDYALLLLQNRFYKSDMKRAMRRRFPGMSFQTIERYLRRARALLPGKYEKILANARPDCIRFWNAQVCNPENDIKVRMYAQEQLDRRVGNDRPIENPNQMPANGGDHPSVVEVVVTSRAEARAIIDLAKSGQVVDVGNLRQLREGVQPTTIGPADEVVSPVSASSSEEVELPAYEPVEVISTIVPSEDARRNGYVLPEDMVDPTIIVPD